MRAGHLQEVPNIVFWKSGHLREVVPAGGSMVFKGSVIL